MTRRTLRLTRFLVAEVETLAAHLYQDQIAMDFGIARSTLYAACERQAECDERHKRRTSKAIAHVASGLLQKAGSGSTTASIVRLKPEAGCWETPLIEHAGAMAIDHTLEDAESPTCFPDRLARPQRQAANQAALSPERAIDRMGDRHART